MAEMTQFRQEVAASEKTNVSALGDLSTALEAALAHEREKAEQERNKLTTEVVALINAVLEGQHVRWSDTVDHARQELSASQNRVQSGYQMVSKGWESWADREGVFSKKLLSNKEEVKKSIVEAAKVLYSIVSLLNLRLLSSVVLQFRRVQDEFTHRLLSWWILR